MSRLKIPHLAACTLITAMGFVVPAAATPAIPLPPPPATQDFAAGEACAFPLTLELSGSKYHLKEFFDKDGNVVRRVIAGKGSLMTLTNNDNDASLSLKAYGFAVQETYGADGTITDVISGHVLVILFPTDVPAGPSTTLYVGRLVETISPTGVGSIQSFTGKATDICAALD